MMIWEADGKDVNFKADTKNFSPAKIELEPIEIDFEKIIDQAWPEKTTYWDRPFCKLATAGRHAKAQEWQCGSMCSELYCKRERSHRGKCSDILIKSDLAKITERLNKLRLEEMDSICGKRRDTTETRYSLKQLKKILRESS